MHSQRSTFHRVLLPLLGGGLLLALAPAVPAQAPGGGINDQLRADIQKVADLLGQAVEQGAPRNEINQIDRGLQDLLRALGMGQHHKKHHHRRHHHRGAFGGGFGQFADAANNPDPNLLNDAPNGPGQNNAAGNPAPGNAPGAGQGGGHGHKGGAFGAGMMQAGAGPDSTARPERRDRDDRHRHRGAFGGGIHQIHHCREEAPKGAADGTTSTSSGSNGLASGGPSSTKGSFGKGIQTASHCTATGTGKANTGKTAGPTGGKGCLAGAHVGQKGTSLAIAQQGGSPNGTAKGSGAGTGVPAAGKAGKKTGGNLLAGSQGSSKPRPTTAHYRGGFTSISKMQLWGGNPGTHAASKGGTKAGAAAGSTARKGPGTKGASTHMTAAGKGPGTRTGQAASRSGSARAGGTRGGPAHTQAARQSGSKGLSAGGHVGARAGTGRPAARTGASHVAASRSSGRQAGASVGARHTSSSGRKR
jgi:hypothetical protein